MSNNYTKECGVCLEVKPANEFHKLKKANDGLQRTCKICTLKKHAEYRSRTSCGWWKHKADAPFLVYIFTNPEGFIYAGKTDTTSRLRYQRHKAQYKNKKHILDLLYASFDEFGFDAHKFEVMSEHETKLQALQAETQTILRQKKLKKSLNSKLSSFPVGQYDKQTRELIKAWDSVGEAANSFNATSSWIYASMRSYRNQRTAHGFIWSILPFPDGSIYDIKTNTLIEKAN